MDDMTVKINRGEDSVKLWFLTVMTEDASTGRVLTAGYTQQMAEDTITMEYTFGDTEVQVTSVQSGKTHTSSLPPVSSHNWFPHSWPQTQGHRSLSLTTQAGQHIACSRVSPRGSRDSSCHRAGPGGSLSLCDKYCTACASAPLSRAVLSDASRLFTATSSDRRIRWRWP
jgi:hypothetical protein